MEITHGVPFESFGLSEAAMRAVRNKGYTVSTPVQAGCIPPMLEGKDVIAKAPTGTGKTMAFGIPIIEALDRDSDKVQAVILAPTRELAIQITDEMRKWPCVTREYASSVSMADSPSTVRSRRSSAAPRSWWPPPAASATT